MRKYIAIVLVLMMSLIMPLKLKAYDTYYNLSIIHVWLENANKWTSIGTVAKNVYSHEIRVKYKSDSKYRAYANSTTYLVMTFTGNYDEVDLRGKEQYYSVTPSSILMEDDNIGQGYGAGRVFYVHGRAMNNPSENTYDFDIDGEVIFYNFSDVRLKLRGVKQIRYMQTNEYIAFLNKLIAEGQRVYTQQQIKELEKIKEEITDDDTDEATSDLGDFLTENEYEGHGVSGIIIEPLNFISNLVTFTPSNLVLPIPFTNDELVLPSFREEIYEVYFNDIYTVYKLIINGITAYWVIVRIFALVKGLQNPNDDKIEVVDL